MTDRSRLYPALRYRDPRAAIDFLKAAFGCKTLALHETPEGAIAHAELKIGEGVVMIQPLSPELAAEGRTASGGSASVYVAINYVDAHHDRAVAAGARITRPPHDASCGAREYGCRDIEGYEWTFGTFDPLAPPHEL